MNCNISIIIWIIFSLAIGYTIGWYFSDKHNSKIKNIPQGNN